jgi:hypothetical protein
VEDIRKGFLKEKTSNLTTEVRRSQPGKKVGDIKCGPHSPTFSPRKKNSTKGPEGAFEMPTVKFCETGAG